MLQIEQVERTALTLLAASEDIELPERMRAQFDAALVAPPAPQPVSTGRMAQMQALFHERGVA